MKTIAGQEYRIQNRLALLLHQLLFECHAGRDVPGRRGLGPFPRGDPNLPVIRRRIERDDSYFNDLSARWGMLLSEARAAIPDPPFMVSS